MGIVEKQLINWKNSVQKDMERNLFIQAFGEDIYNSTENDYKDMELRLQDYQGNRFNYRFTRAYVVRNTETKVDTFNLPVTPRIIGENTTRRYIYLSGAQNRDSLRLLFELPLTQTEEIKTLFFYED